MNIYEAMQITNRPETKAKMARIKAELEEENNKEESACCGAPILEYTFCKACGGKICSIIK